MAQTNINIRMDKELKEQFDLFCSNVGMSMTTAFCIFAKKAVREQKIPFEVRANSFDENIPITHGFEAAIRLKDECSFSPARAHFTLYLFLSLSLSHSLSLALSFPLFLSASFGSPPHQSRACVWFLSF